MRGGGDELLRADARRDVGERGLDAETPVQPASNGVSQWLATDRCRIAALAVARCQCRDHVGSRRVARGADREVDHTAVEGRRQWGQSVESVVGVWRGDETGGIVHAFTILPDRRAS